MRHRIKTQNLSRFSSYYKATLKSLAQAVVKHQRIVTTKLKAKLARGLVERLVTWGKQSDSLSARRMAYRYLCDHALVQKLFSDIAPMFRDRKGGYTRIIPYKRRRGDNAELVLLEFTVMKDVVKPARPVVEKKAAQEKPEKAPKVQAEPAGEKEAHKKESKKPAKKPMGGFRKIFKSSKRDSL
ncbi:MAG: 50S ribosomal protein L17 [Candidatus Omnitrophota bacterium]